MNPKRRVIPVFIPHFGCVNSCVFCDQRKISGGGAHVGADEIESVISAAAFSGTIDMPAQLAFYGGSFTSLPTEKQNELLNAAQPFLSFNHANSIRISARPDAISESDAERLKSFSVKTIEIGAQSMCDEVLSRSRRGHSADDIVRSAKIVKAAGIELILQMMTGLPGDDDEKSKYTAKRFIQLAPEGVRIYPAVVLKDTELHNMWRLGLYSPHTVDKAVDICAVLCDMFKKAAVPVIRIGLNPTELLAKEALAGAYHPALGELVYSKMYYNEAADRLRGIPPGSSITIYVAQSCVSKMAGHKRGNIHLLIREFALSSLRVIGADIPEGKMRIVLY